MLKSASIFFLLIHLFQAFQGLEKSSLFTCERLSAVTSVGEISNKATRENSDKLPVSSTSGTDVELIDTGGDNDVWNKYTSSNPCSFYSNYSFLSVGRIVVRLDDQLQLEMLSPPPEHTALI